MARLPSTVDFPTIEDLLEERRSPREFWDAYISEVQHWFERLVARTNEELIENNGTEIVNMELVLSGADAKFGVGGTTRLTKLLSLTTSIDLPSIPANSQAEVTLTFTGVVQGAEVVVNPDSTPETGLIIGMAWASATDEVKIRFVNVTGAAIDPAARTYRVSVRVYA